MPGATAQGRHCSLGVTVRKNSQRRARLLFVGIKKNGLILEYGARFGDVGEQRFDYGGVLLLDDAALELECKG